MRLTLCFIIFMNSGCLSGMVLEGRNNQAIKTAAFDTRCQNLTIKDRMVDSSGTVRYILSGCGHEYVYQCSNARPYGDHTTQRSEMAQIFTSGSMTIDASCSMIREYPINQQTYIEPTPQYGKMPIEYKELPRPDRGDKIIISATQDPYNDLLKFVDSIVQVILNSSQKIDGVLIKVTTTDVIINQSGNILNLPIDGIDSITVQK